jgi:predicted  nucleic acid-binding Zn-ribbon protein
MSDPSVTLSLGGRWLHQSAEREKQGQLIANLTNQLEGLRAAYQEDLQQVAENKKLLLTMQAALDKVEAERDEWKAAYNGVVNKRIERDHLVEDLVSKMTTLELTTRQEEISAAEALRRSTMLQKEKELLHTKVDKLKAELDETYTKLAAANDRVASHDEEVASLNQALATMTRSRDTKEHQVVSLLKEKARLFRLVTDLRSTMGVVQKSDPTKQGILSSSSSSKGGDSSFSTSDLSASVGSSSRSRSRTRPPSASGVTGTGNRINATLAGIIDRPRWHSTAPSIADKTAPTSAKKPMTSQEQLDEMASAGSVASAMLGESALLRKRHGTSRSRSRGRTPHQEEEEKESGPLRTNDLENSTDHTTQDVDQHRESSARATVLLRLKRQIDLLTEKNSELEKASGLIQTENQLLLVRFRAAHERRKRAERTAKEVQQELEQVKEAAGLVSGGGAGLSGGAAGGFHQGHTDEHPHFDLGWQHQEPQPHSFGRRPAMAGTAAAGKPNTPGRWK